MAKLSEKFMLEKAGPTGTTSCGEIINMDLSSMQIKDIDASLFNQLVKIEDLNLSNNRIHEFPNGLILPALKKLDLSDNTISSVSFLKNFQNLEVLNLIANPLTEADKYFAVFLLPKLNSLEDLDTVETRKRLETFKSRIMEEIDMAWGANFQEQYEEEEELSESDLELIYSNLLKTVKKQRNIPKSDEKWLKLFDEMTQILATDFFQKFRTQAEMVDRKKRKVEKEKQKTEAENKSTEGASNGSSVAAKKEKRKLQNAALPTCPDYEPVHFLRCHSYNNDPADSKTKIWRCAFQPKPKPKGLLNCSSNGVSSETPSSTSSCSPSASPSPVPLSAPRIVATCGGDSICLIDCSTGKVMKKYKHAKEDFYCVAWTTLDIPNPDSDKATERTNILAAAGQQGDIKLLQPDQLLCYAQMKGHKKHVNCLLFHSSNPSLLFSGSNDKSVMLWDIGIPVLPVFKTKYKALIRFTVPVPGPCDVLNLHLHDDRYIIAATESHCAVWDSSDPEGARKSLGPKGTKSPKGPRPRKHLLELELPYMHTTSSIMDGLVGLSKKLVATKYVQDGLISFWDLDMVIKTNTDKAMPMASVEAVTQVKWSDTDQLYINLNASEDGGMLLAGDDTGSIWIYNLRGMGPWGGSDEPDPTKLYQPSRIIEWPEIQIKSNDMGDLKDPQAKKVIINHLAISDDELYIVACTDNNIVCIWKQCDD